MNGKMGWIYISYVYVIVMNTNRIKLLIPKRRLFVKKDWKFIGYLDQIIDLNLKHKHNLMIFKEIELTNLAHENIFGKFWF